MTEFRFPHPYDNVKEAIDKADDGLTGSLSNLAVQLLDENNRAVEDAINSGDSGGSVSFGTVRTASGDYTATTAVLEDGIWLVDGVAQPNGWTGTPGQMEAEISVGSGGDTISGPYRSIDGVDMPIRIPTYRFVSDGISTVDMEQVVLSGTISGTPSIVVTATYLGPTAE